MKRKKLNKAPSFTAMHLALLIFCGVIITTHSTGVLYAKYKSEASASASGTVARFEVTEQLTVINSDGDKESQPIDSFIVNDTLKPGESTTYQFKVKNKSDVAINFIISGKTVFNELPLTLETVEVEMAPGEEKTIEFKVLWDQSTAENLSLDFCGKIDMIEIFVTAEQID